MARTPSPSLRWLLSALAILALFRLTASSGDFPHCNCDDEEDEGGGGGGGMWRLETIMECQRVSDVLIAAAYFSIPLELLYFISFSSLPFKWVFLQFVAFIVLCGLTHLLNAWTYYGPHSFHLVLSLTVAKFLTALVSCATAITLLTLIPLLLKVKVRELFLRQNVMELDQEVGMMKRQKEASWHVRMLTREIRKSLDKHTILYTTLVELSKALGLRNCAVWLPDDRRTAMTLFHELKTRRGGQTSIPTDDPDVADVLSRDGAAMVSPESALGGPGVAIRMPILKVSNFKAGGTTPESVEARYAILVLAEGEEGRWGPHEMEIVEAVADQVAVALSHAGVLEESQAMREKLAEQNRELESARRSAATASQARVTFQKVMSHGMRRPMHSVSGLLSMLREDCALLPDHRRVVLDTMLKSAAVLSALVDDVMQISAAGDALPFRAAPFDLRSTVKEAACLVKCLCIFAGLPFQASVQSSLPALVVGDEKRAFQVILHMAGYLLTACDSDTSGGTAASFRVSLERGAAAAADSVGVVFEFDIGGSLSAARRRNTNEAKGSMSFDICKRLVHMMQGNIWISTNEWGFAQSMTLVLRFQNRPSFGRATDQPRSNPSFRGLRVILADDDDVNRTVTKKLLEKLGCHVLAVSSGFECLSAVTTAENCYRVVLLDIHMPEMDGFEVALRIRKFRNERWPLIIAVTASAEDHVSERCFQMGMNGLIRKPVVLKVLAEELNRVLMRSDDGL